MKSIKIVPGDRKLMSNKYKHNSRNVLVCIDVDGVGSTEPGDPYLSRFSNNYYNVSTLTFVHTEFLGRYFNSYNVIDNHNRMSQSYPDLEK